MVMGMAAPRPLYVTSTPTAATIRRTMQVHGQTSTSRGEGGRGPHSTRAVLAVSAPRPHLYISALLPRPHDAIFFFLSSGFLSINSRLLLAIKTTVIISFISFCRGVSSHSLYLPPPITLYPHSSCTEYTSIIFALWYHCHCLYSHTSRNTFDNHTT